MAEKRGVEEKERSRGMSWCARCAYALLVAQKQTMARPLQSAKKTNGEDPFKGTLVLR